MKCTIPEISWHNRDPVLSLDIQPIINDGFYRLASGGTDAHVLIWHLKILETGAVSIEAVCDLTRHQRAVNVVRWAPSGAYLASGDDDASIIIWHQKPDDFAVMMDGDSNDKEKWSILKVLRGHKEDVYDICWSPDSSKLISGSVDNTAIIWDFVKGLNDTILQDHKGFVQGVSWDPLGQYLATLSSDRTCRIFSSEPGRQIKTRISRGLLPVPENHLLHGQVVRYYHDDTLKSFFRRLTFSPDGNLVITPAGYLEVGPNNKRLYTTYIYTTGMLSQPAAVLPSPNQYTIAVRCCPILFNLWPDGPDPIITLPYRMVFAVATRSSVLLYDTQQPTPFAVISNIHYTRLTDVTWSSDGRILAVSSTDGFCSLVTFEPQELGTEYIKEEELIEDDVTEIENVEEGITDLNASLDEKLEKKEQKEPRKPSFLEQWTKKAAKNQTGSKTDTKIPSKMEMDDDVIQIESEPEEENNKENVIAAENPTKSDEEPPAASKVNVEKPNWKNTPVKNLPAKPIAVRRKPRSDQMNITQFLKSPKATTSSSTLKENPAEVSTTLLKTCSVVLTNSNKSIANKTGDKARTSESGTEEKCSGGIMLVKSKSTKGTKGSRKEPEEILKSSEKNSEAHKDGTKTTEEPSKKLDESVQASVSTLTKSKMDTSQVNKSESKTVKNLSKNLKTSGSASTKTTVDNSQAEKDATKMFEEESSKKIEKVLKIFGSALTKKKTDNSTVTTEEESILKTSKSTAKKLKTDNSQLDRNTSKTVIEDFNKKPEEILKTFGSAVKSTTDKDLKSASEGTTSESSVSVLKFFETALAKSTDSTKKERFSKILYSDDNTESLSALSSEIISVDDSQDIKLVLEDSVLSSESNLGVSKNNIVEKIKIDDTVVAETQKDEEKIVSIINTEEENIVGSQTEEGENLEENTENNEMELGRQTHQMEIVKSDSPTCKNNTVEVKKESQTQMDKEKSLAEKMDVENIQLQMQKEDETVKFNSTKLENQQEKMDTANSATTDTQKDEKDLTNSNVRKCNLLQTEQENTVEAQTNTDQKDSGEVAQENDVKIHSETAKDLENNINTEDIIKVKDETEASVSSADKNNVAVTENANLKSQKLASSSTKQNSYENSEENRTERTNERDRILEISDAQNPVNLPKNNVEETIEMEKAALIELNAEKTGDKRHNVEILENSERPSKRCKREEITDNEINDDNKINEKHQQTNLDQKAKSVCEKNTSREISEQNSSASGSKIREESETKTETGTTVKEVGGITMEENVKKDEKVPCKKETPIVKKRIPLITLSSPKHKKKPFN